jgi:SAM-dependent methyltransferase
MSNTVNRECEDLRARAFDELAGTYDATFTHTPVGRALRDIVWSRLENTFHASHCILDLGCGTGEDAVRLARRGIRVVATDASLQMIQVARQKTRGCDCTGRVEFHCLAMEDLGASLEGEVFDGVLSNFGAINCARDLPSLIASVAARLTPGAPLFWVVMGRYVPWEWMWYLLRGDWRRALRRLRPGGVSWRGLTISYPTPARMTSLLRPHFAVRRVTALGFALPPSYAAAWLERSPRILKALTRLEALAQRSRALAACSDHYIVEATRLPASAGA